MSESSVRRRGGCCQALVQPDEAWAHETAEVLKALGEPTRLSMVAALWAAQAPVCVCDFTAAYELSQPTISHHMARLKAAGLVRSTKQGIWVYYRLRDDLAPATRALLQALLAQPARRARTGSRAPGRKAVEAASLGPALGPPSNGRRRSRPRPART